MQPYDVLMLAILLLAVLWGAWKGLAWQIASLASLVLSYFVALKFRQPVAALIDASPPWNMFAAMLILFLATALAVWVGFNFVSELIERVKLKEFDRQLGALFGAAKGVLLCVLITLFAVGLLGDVQRQAICNSRSGHYIAVLLDRADAVIPPELHEVLDPYIHKLEATVGPAAAVPQKPQMPDRSTLFGRPDAAAAAPASAGRPPGFPASEVPSARPAPIVQRGPIEARPAPQTERELRRW